MPAWCIEITDNNMVVGKNKQVALCQQMGGLSLQSDYKASHIAAITSHFLTLYIKVVTVVTGQ